MKRSGKQADMAQQIERNQERHQLMRQGPNGRRPRGRHHGGSNGGENVGRGPSSHTGNGGGNGGSGGNVGGSRPRSASSLRHQSFDSNCGDLRVRGNAWQVHEKYQALARDAASSGDRVGAENFLQHAEHYFRIIEAIDEATAAEQHVRGPQASPAFGQQPEVPRNYYGTDQAPQPESGDSNGNLASQPQLQPQPQQQPRAEATVQQRNPPPSPFFTPEEIDEHNGDQPLTAVR
jgi:hypothetical protein